MNWIGLLQVNNDKQIRENFYGKIGHCHPIFSFLPIPIPQLESDSNSHGNWEFHSHCHVPDLPWPLSKCSLGPVILLFSVLFLGSVSVSGIHILTFSVILYLQYIYDHQHFTYHVHLSLHAALYLISSLMQLSLYASHASPPPVSMSRAIGHTISSAPDAPCCVISVTPMAKEFHR